MTHRIHMEVRDGEAMISLPILRRQWQAIFGRNEIRILLIPSAAQFRYVLQTSGQFVEGELEEVILFGIAARGTAAYWPEVPLAA